ncbi:hypothetical protein OIU85_008115 [Salix viminalis]|uniref:Uncharacterized protein n=1 Tax=Salix viminalis TaxID=40686 RepID=A0A9Q0PAJ4_SALVM|nr:hypothetical protein OIU85_008115 [Salix viminalis]
MDGEGVAIKKAENVQKKFASLHGDAGRSSGVRKSQSYGNIRKEHTLIFQLKPFIKLAGAYNFRSPNVDKLDLSDVQWKQFQ